MIRGITGTHIQSVWNHSGPSEVPYSGQKLFCCFLQETGSSTVFTTKFNGTVFSNTKPTYLRAILKALKKDLDDEAACSTKGGPLKTKVY